MSATNHWLELSRARLLHNLASVRAIVGQTRLIAVVKANAYGAGAVGLAQILAEQGVDAFAVAAVAEGVELRQQGITGLILCLTYFTRAEVADIFAHDLTPTVFTDEALQLLAEGARQYQRRQPVWVKVDTGLNRLGVPHSRAAEFIRHVAAHPSLQFAGMFSTITENPARDATQLERLRAVRQQLNALEPFPVSIASSHAILSLPQSYLDAVRPGIMLLGFEPSERERLDMRLVQQANLQPIVTWKTRVGYVKVVPAGEQVGYGIRPTLLRDTPIATLTTGWADGYSPLLSNGGEVLIREQRCPVLAVSANSTLVEVAHAPAVSIGEEVVLLGRQGEAELTPYELAHITGSVYRLLSPIPRTTPRHWV
jgi:alanine racemase